MHSAPRRERIAMVSGSEYDAFVKKAKRWYNWGPGVRKWIKNKFNRRARRAGKVTP